MDVAFNTWCSLQAQHNREISSPQVKEKWFFVLADKTHWEAPFCDTIDQSVCVSSPGEHLLLSQSKVIRWNRTNAQNCSGVKIEVSGTQRSRWVFLPKLRPWCHGLKQIPVFCPSAKQNCAMWFRLWCGQSNWRWHKQNQRINTSTDFWAFVRVFCAVETGAPKIGLMCLEH